MNKTETHSTSKASKFRRIILISVMVASPIVLSACGSSSGGPGTSTTQMPGY